MGRSRTNHLRRLTGALLCLFGTGALAWLAPQKAGATPPPPPSTATPPAATHASSSAQTRNKADNGTDEAREKSSELGQGGSTKQPHPTDALPEAQYLPRYSVRRSGAFIYGSQRIEVRKEEVRVASEAFPSGGTPYSLKVGAHLGGGYLFYQVVTDQGHSATNFYRTDEFTAPLQPLAQLPFSVSEVRIGFDRIYALGTSLHVALDPKSGAVLPLNPLPPVITLEGLAFSGSRLAAVQAPLVGVLGTFDAGLTWHPLREAEAIEPSSVPPTIQLKTKEGIRILGPDLKLDHLAAKPNDTQGQASGFLGADDWVVDLSLALSHGIELDDHAVALARGKLIRAPLTGPFRLHRSSAPVDPSASCRSVPNPATKGALFLCSGSQLTLFAYQTEKLRLVESAAPHPILSDGPGAFLLDGPCQSRPKSEAQANAALPPQTKQAETKKQLCWLTERGATTLSFKPTKGPARYQSFATSGRGVHRIVWDPKGRRFVTHQLSRAPSKTKKAAPKTHTYPLEHQETLANLLSEGSLLPHASEEEDGFSVWVIQGEKFVGARLFEGGSLDYGAVQRPLSKTLFYGNRAYLWGASGFAKQSLDGGLHFEELTIPYRNPEPELSAPLDASTPTFMGCGHAGCSLGSMLRRGWSSEPLSLAQDGPRRRLIHPGGSRHHFTCFPSGSATPPRRRELASDWEGFWENAPPAMPGGFEGRSVGFPHDLARLYASGPQDLSWNRDGRLQLHFLDPYSIETIKKSAPSPDLAANLVAAETLLGTIDRSGSSTVFLLDPGGTHGAVLLRTRSVQTLLTFGEGTPLQSVPIVDPKTQQELNIRTPLGVVEANGRTFLAYYSDRDDIAVAELDETGMHRFAAFHVGEVGGRNLSLVRSTRGDLGLSMEGDRGLFVYPLSMQGELGLPIIAPHRSTRPPSCAPEASGFIVERELPLSPYLEAESGQAIRTSGLRAKMIVSQNPACLEAMTARVRSLPPLSPAKKSSGGVPLTLLNSDSAGNRTQLLCE